MREIAFVALCSFVAFASSARGSEIGDGVAKLLDLGLKGTPSAVTAARTQYDELKQQSPHDRRLDYAFGLVLMNQHKYHDALPLISGFLKSGKPTDGELRVKILAQIQDRQYGAAMDEIASLSRRFPADPRHGEEGQYLEMAKFFGTMFGYLELARLNTADANLRSQCKNDVLDRLADRYLPAFDDGRAIVLTRLGELRAEREAQQELTKTEKQERQSKAQSLLKGDQQSISVQQENIKSSSEQLREAERELNVIRQQLDSLIPDRTRLSAKIIIAQTQISQLRLSGPLVNNPQDPKYIQQATVPNGAEATEIAQLRALYLGLYNFNKQAFDLDRRILALQNRAAELAVGGQREAEKLERSDAEVRKAAKHAKGVEKKLNRESSKTKARPNAMTSQMTSLSTYVPFPYEQEKERVLKWFADQPAGK